MRRKPDRIHTQIMQIIQFIDHSFKITHAIAVPVGKRAWVDLIENSALPPFMFSHLIHSATEILIKNFSFKKFSIYFDYFHLADCIPKIGRTP